MMCIYVRPYLAQVFSEWKIFQTEIVEKRETRNLFQYILLIKPYRLQDNVENYSRVGHSTDEYMAHADCILDAKRSQTHLEYAILIAFPLQWWL
jgi:hypothetical protein